MSERTDTAQGLHLRHSATPELPPLPTSHPPPLALSPALAREERRRLRHGVGEPTKTPKVGRSGMRQDPQDKAGRLCDRSPYATGYLASLSSSESHEENVLLDEHAITWNRTGTSPGYVPSHHTLKLIQGERVRMTIVIVIVLSQGPSA